MCTKSAIIKPECECHAISVGGATGPQNVATIWKEHFEKLHNSNVGNKYRNGFEKKIKNLSDVSFTSSFSLKDVRATVAIQKCGKVPGPDNIHMEAFIYRGHRLQLLLSCLFNLVLHYDAFHRATIIPLVKCKTGHMTESFKSHCCTNLLILRMLLMNISLGLKRATQQ